MPVYYYYYYYYYYYRVNCAWWAHFPARPTFDRLNCRKLDTAIHCRAQCHDPRLHSRLRRRRPWCLPTDPWSKCSIPRHQRARLVVLYGFMLLQTGWIAVSSDSPLPSDSQTSELWCSSGGKRGDYQNCSVLYCVLKLHTVISTLRWAVLTVLWIGFCLTGSISLCVDLFVFVCICVFLFHTA